MPMRPASSTCIKLTKPRPFAKQVIGRHLALVEEHLARVARPHPEFVSPSCRAQTLGPALDDEGRDALRRSRSVTAAMTSVADTAVGREGLEPSDPAGAGRTAVVRAG
jgi:hypothetical protein